MPVVEFTLRRRRRQPQRQRSDIGQVIRIVRVSVSLSVHIVRARGTENNYVDGTQRMACGVTISCSINDVCVCVCEPQSKHVDYSMAICAHILYEKEKLCLCVCVFALACGLHVAAAAAASYSVSNAYAASTHMPTNARKHKHIRHTTHTPHAFAVSECNLGQSENTALTKRNKVCRLCMTLSDCLADWPPDWPQSHHHKWPNAAASAPPAF